MNRRTIAIAIFILGLLMLSGVGVIFILQQDEPPAETDQPPVAEDGGVPGISDEATPAQELMEVVVSNQTLPRGYQITESDVAEGNDSVIKVEMRLASEVGANVVTSKEELAGLYVRSQIFQGETLTYDAFVRDLTLIGVEDVGPSSLIPSGFIAASVPMDRLSGVAYSLREGDYVDIMITFFFYQIDEEFQTYLQNTAVFFLEEAIQAEEQEEEDGGTEQTTTPEIFVISPFGRFEELANGDLAHVGPSEPQRPVPVAMVLQNARVIQVGLYRTPEPPTAPTPTPGEEVEGPTPTAEAATLTPTPPVPDSLLVALSPQQQLFLKYAIESNANIDFALRGANDGQLFSVENVDINYFIERFNVESPPDFDFSVDKQIAPVTPTPTLAPPGGES